LLAQNGRLDEARRQLATALELEPGRSEYQQALAWLVGLERAED
jgi:Flp pilus assembly protein TadD